MFMSKISSEKIIIISLIKIMLPHAQLTHKQHCFPKYLTQCQWSLCNFHFPDLNKPNNKHIFKLSWLHLG